MRSYVLNVYDCKLIGQMGQHYFNTYYFAHGKSHLDNKARELGLHNKNLWRMNIFLFVGTDADRLSIRAGRF